jgi:hypothetical protein
MWFIVGVGSLLEKCFGRIPILTILGVVDMESCQLSASGMRGVTEGDFESILHAFTGLSNPHANYATNQLEVHLTIPKGLFKRL